jgi:hypothetical protein
MTDALIALVGVLVGWAGYQGLAEWRWRRAERRRALRWAAEIRRVLDRQNALAEQRARVLVAHCGREPRVPPR